MNDKESYYKTCESCGRPMAYCKGQCCGKTKGCQCKEYCGSTCAAIRPGEPKCPPQAVIPSLTVESVSNLKDLADCFVHVSDINTTFYIDDKHRIMTTWAGLVSVEDYDFAANPLNLRGQIAYDAKNNTAAIYDKQGANYIFQISDINNDYMLLENKPQINGVTLEGNKTSADLNIPDVDEVAQVFDTVADMQAASNLVNGSYAQTLGYYSINDGGKSLYKITNSGTADGGAVIALANSLFAHLVIKDEVYVEQFGAVGDGATDDMQALQAAIDYAYTNKVNVRLGNKTYVITEPLLIYGNPDPGGKATEIEGNGIGKSIIKKTTNTAKADANGNSFDAIFIVSKQESGGGAHNIRIENMSLIGNGVAHYAIAEKIPLVGAELKRLSIENFTDAGIYCTGNTYLDRITQVRCAHCATGFYIYGGTNTSLVVANCYAVSCANGYKISGSYSQLDSPACDGATGIVYDLENFRGTVISAGSESTNAETVFKFNGSYCTLINPMTLPNYDNANAFHVKLGNGSHVTVIGGRMLWDALGRNYAAKGGFVDNGYLSNIVIEDTAVGDFEKKSTNYPASASSSKCIKTQYGTVNTYGDERVSYIGADGRSTSGLVKTGNTNETLQSTAIFLGGGFAKWQTFNGQDMRGSKSPLLGDLYLSKRPNEIGGIGWVQTGDALNVNWKINTMKKIPIIQSGVTADRPIYGQEVGQQYFDTTLNKPVWIKTVGAVCSITFTITTDASSAGTIAFSMFNMQYSIQVSAGESAASIRSKFLAIVDPQFVTSDLNDGRVRYVSLAQKHFDTSASSIDNGSTGANITIFRDSGLNATWVDATGTTV